METRYEEEKKRTCGCHLESKRSVAISIFPLVFFKLNLCHIYETEKNNLCESFPTHFDYNCGKVFYTSNIVFNIPDDFELKSKISRFKIVS